MTESSGQHVLLLGATGLVGSRVLGMLLADRRVARVTAPTRRALGCTDTRLHNPLLDFAALPAAQWWAADAVICCLGTTRKQAGSLAAFVRVDRDYVLAAAVLARAAGTPCFVLNSASGADPSSRLAYNRTKGQVEAGLRAQSWPSLVLVRPGLIGGERAQRRPAEHAAGLLLQALGPVLPRAWRINPAANIAAALVQAALTAPAGEQVIGAAELA
ncbi:NAD-dependent dehydratase [Stenotrophomonas ginsengisoli]|uniref:NAD-dependent dehydratase n=1 Tax=Stenotrophomonas ginsengisoli TaxID=336566 RepID=A0A0R0D358_9GAMM|nr:NAD-dependent dehydratase [Stenotrophomonas ginsengisoli]KRG76556.1 NAD-dependent dehydratase [Stenotrophomonas ginsengisoli]